MPLREAEVVFKYGPGCRTGTKEQNTFIIASLPDWTGNSCIDYNSCITPVIPDNGQAKWKIWIFLWGSSVSIWVIPTHGEASPYLFVKNDKFVCMYIHTYNIYKIIYETSVLEKNLFWVVILREQWLQRKKVENMLKWILCQLFSLLDSLLRLRCIWRIQRMRAFRIK